MQNKKYKIFQNRCKKPLKRPKRSAELSFPRCNCNAAFRLSSFGPSHYPNSQAVGSSLDQLIASNSRGLLAPSSVNQPLFSLLLMPCVTSTSTATQARLGLSATTSSPTSTPAPRGPTWRSSTAGSSGPTSPPTASSPAGSSPSSRPPRRGMTCGTRARCSTEWPNRTRSCGTA